MSTSPSAYVSRGRTRELLVWYVHVRYTTIVYIYIGTKSYLWTLGRYKCEVFELNRHNQSVSRYRYTELCGAQRLEMANSLFYSLGLIAVCLLHQINVSQYVFSGCDRAVHRNISCYCMI